VVKMIKIKKENFSVDDILDRITTKSTGATVTFVGIVRSTSKGKIVKKIEIQVYKDMAQKQLKNIRNEAIKRFGVEEIAIIHRYGSLKVSERIMMIAVIASHRQEAFEACRYVLEEIKKRVPIWKKEFTEDGTFWVEGEHNKSN